MHIVNLILNGTHFRACASQLTPYHMLVATKMYRTLSNNMHHNPGLRTNEAELRMKMDQVQRCFKAKLGNLWIRIKSNVGLSLLQLILA